VAGGTDVSALIDNDSKTQVTLTGSQPPSRLLCHGPSGPHVHADQRNLTGTAPSA